MVRFAFAICVEFYQLKNLFVKRYVAHCMLAFTLKKNQNLIDWRMSTSE